MRQVVLRGSEKEIDTIALLANLQQSGLSSPAIGLRVCGTSTSCCVWQFETTGHYGGDVVQVGAYT